MKTNSLNVTVIIPSYKPDEKLCEVIDGLTTFGFDDIIVVDDGSGPDFARFFPDVLKYKNCHMIRHEANCGKGAALKTAMRFFTLTRKTRAGVVTVDGDNQHLPEDVFACTEEMIKQGALILGSRDFSSENVPKRSKIGNRITSTVFRFGCGLKISDTQTGLRAIPASYVPELLDISGERYEYETNMLLELKRLGIPFLEKRIHTVYINDNQTSHFHAFRDSIRIYALILKFMLSSGVSSIVDLFAFFLFSLLLDPLLGDLSVLVCTMLARIISSVLNCFINKSLVFRCKNGACRTLLRYYALAIPQMLISAGLVQLLKTVFSGTSSIFSTILKLIVDVVLFFISFRIQREWVFKESKNEKK